MIVEQSRAPSVHPMRNLASPANDMRAETPEKSVSSLIAKGVPSLVPLGKLVRGKNPRTYFSPTAHQELVASVREHGIIQPLLIRLLGDDTLQIIAGERRYRAAMDVFTADEQIPVLIFECDDDTAHALAMVENIQREGMSPTEEAEEAARMVGRLNGNRDEVARQIGWSRQMLDSRLALMNCSQEVKQALTERRILLGHAELLAALAKDKQNQVLPVLIAEKKTIAELRTFVDQIGCKLETAIFNKSDCGTCPHNSSLQAEMFSEAIAAGSCTNKPCFTDKTQAHLDIVKEGMKDEYPTIRILRPGDNHTRTQLVVDGDRGVGEAQGKACHACQNFGAAVSGLPDSLGKVYRGQCFDTACNARHVATRIKSELSPKSSVLKPTAASGSATGATSVSAKKDAPDQAATSVRESDPVKAYRVALWRKALRREVAADSNLARGYLIAIALTGFCRAVDGSQIEKTFDKLIDDVDKRRSVTDLAENATLLAAISAEGQTAMITAMALSGIQGIEVHNLVQLCEHHKLDLEKHWKLSKDFLQLLTKSEMKFLADQIGLRKHLGEAFNKLFSKSKVELIDALLNVDGFDYNGKIPAVLKY